MQFRKGPSAQVQGHAGRCPASNCMVPTTVGHLAICHVCILLSIHCRFLFNVYLDIETFLIYVPFHILVFPSDFFHCFCVENLFPSVRMLIGFFLIEVTLVYNII